MKAEDRAAGAVFYRRAAPEPSSDCLSDDVLFEEFIKPIAPKEMERRVSRAKESLGRAFHFTDSYSSIGLEKIRAAELPPSPSFPAAAGETKPPGYSCLRETTGLEAAARKAWAPTARKAIAIAAAPAIRNIQGLKAAL